jgi:NADH:ubiquinone oxidoreductase subunit 6 (subunit J)
MTSGQIFFILLAVTTSVLSIMAVSSRSMTRAAYYLISVLTATSAMFLILGLPALALFNLVASAGGTAFLIRRALLKSIKEPEPETKTMKWVRIAGSIALGAALLIITIVIISRFGFAPVTEPAVDLGAKNTLKHLFSVGKDGFMLPAALLLILVIISVISVNAVAVKDEQLTGKVTGNKKK